MFSRPQHGIRDAVGALRHLVVFIFFRHRSICLHFHAVSDQSLHGNRRQPVIERNAQVRGTWRYAGERRTAIDLGCRFGKRWERCGGHDAVFRNE